MTMAKQDKGILRRTYGRLGRRGRISAWIAAVLVALILAVTLGSYLFDGPLRRELEKKMNANLHGYSVRLGHAHAGLFGLSLFLSDLVVRQQANPEPPVAVIPYLHLSIEWPQLLRRHLVGDAFFRQPSIHANLPQLRREASDRMSPRDRGWQQAFESIYPLKFNRFRVRDGSIVYVDADPKLPLEITHWNLTATNIRNIEVGDHVYPSPIETEGAIFGTGSGSIEGSANFLSQPYPGVHAIYRLHQVPLDRLEPIGARSNLELHGGVLSSRGEVEYSPRYKIVQVANILLDGVRVDYIHSAATATQEHRNAQEVKAAAREAENAPLDLRLDQLHLTHGSVGYVNRTMSPNYRLFVDDANLDMQNLSNRAARRTGQPASAHLRGRFMGSGSALVTATFRPEAATADFGGEVQIENASLPALNDMLRAYEKIGVAGGTVSVYAQVAVKNGYLRGYVKPLVRDVQVADPRQENGKPAASTLKEKVVGGLAHLLRNHKTQAVATRADISGPLEAPRTSTLEVFAGLLRNAFFKAILPGFDDKGKHPPAKG
jgi:Domain of Unknown Function (DUF748)